VTDHSSRVSQPPAGLEQLLRWCLPPDERDPISGDLLEEYREAVLPARGRTRAQLWYLRQTLGLVVWGLTCSKQKTERSRAMRLNVMRSSLWWAAGGTMMLIALLVPFALGRFGPPVPFPLALVTALLLVAVSAPVPRSRPEWRSIARLGLLWGIALTVVLASRMVLDALAPVDPLDRFLAQATDGYSEWDYPRRWMLGVAVVVTSLGAGCTGARRHHDVRMGILVALAASLVGALLSVLVAATGRSLLGPEGFFFDAEGVLPMSMIGTLLGTVGAMIGRGAPAASPRRATDTN
jgi:hypothetical protein